MSWKDIIKTQYGRESDPSNDSYGDGGVDDYEEEGKYNAHLDYMDSLEPNRHHADNLIWVAKQLKKAKTTKEGLKIMMALKSDLEEWIETFQANIDAGN